VLQAATSLQDQGLYQPRTKDTQRAYEELLSFVQHQIGAQPREYLASGADEVLAILKVRRALVLAWPSFTGCNLKDEAKSDPEKRKVGLTSLSLSLSLSLCLSFSL
jgi:hypothetical protein